MGIERSIGTTNADYDKYRCRCTGTSGNGRFCDAGTAPFRGNFNRVKADLENKSHCSNAGKTESYVFAEKCFRANGVSGGKGCSRKTRLRL